MIYSIPINIDTTLTEARGIVDYLIDKGINSNQLSYKGYGKTEPLTFSPNPKAQAKNQRVEIKILNFNNNGRG